MSVPSIVVNPERFQLVVGVREDCTLELSNLGYEAVMFRLLTNAPQRYIVRHTKGVIKGNTTASVTIALNRSGFTDVAPDAVTKDDFRLEYCHVGPDDAIEPRSANVPQLIKDRKADKSAVVLKKTLRVHVLGEAGAAGAAAAAAAAGGATPPSAGSAGSNFATPQAAAGGGGMSAMEADTLREKNRRKEVSAGAAGSGAQTGKQQKQSGMQSKLAVAVAVAVVVLGLYMLLL